MYLHYLFCVIFRSMDQRTAEVYWANGCMGTSAGAQRQEHRVHRWDRVRFNPRGLWNGVFINLHTKEVDRLSAFALKIFLSFFSLLYADIFQLR